MYIRAERISIPDEWMHDAKPHNISRNFRHDDNEFIRRTTNDEDWHIEP